MATNTVIRKKSNTAAIVQALRTTSVYIGLPQDSDAYPDGTSLIEVATDHEFGSEQARSYTSTRGNKVSVSGVPERSFLRSTAKEKRSEWSELVTKGVKSVLKGKITVKDAMNKVGLRAESDVKKKIVAISDPPNSPQVIADKGSSNPLIDTGHLVNSITHVLRK